MNQKNSNSHERFLRVYTIAAPVFPVLALLAAIGFFLAMKNDFDSVIGHFAVGSAPFTLTVISIIAAALLAAALSLLARRTASVTADIAENPLTIFGAVLGALMSFACLFTFASDLGHGAAVSKPALFAAVLTPFIGLSMILSLIPKLRTSPVRQICAICAAVSVNLSLFADYFDFTLPLNSPVRNLITITEAALLLHLLSEARISFGQKSGRISLSFAVFSAGTAASAALGYSLGALLTDIAAPTAANPNPDVFTLALYAALSIHALGRLITLKPVIGKYAEPPKEEKKKK